MRPNKDGLRVDSASLVTYLVMLLAGGVVVVGGVAFVKKLAQRPPKLARRTLGT
jgi:hypothetical protein